MARLPRRMSVPDWVPPASRIPKRKSPGAEMPAQIPLHMPTPMPYWPAPDPQRPDSKRGGIIIRPDGTHYRL